LADRRDQVVQLEWLVQNGYDAGCPALDALAKPLLLLPERYCHRHDPRCPAPGFPGYQSRHELLAGFQYLRELLG
jgi:hypothetical protein